MSLNMDSYSLFIEKAAKILPNGAFLTTKDMKKTNTMTIGWGTFGFQWGMPTVEVMVRKSRYTKGLLDKSMEFTLTFPTSEDMKSALAYCGKKSGRDCDKIKDSDLSLIPAKEVSTPVVSCKGLVFECKIVSKSEMDPSLVSSEVADKWYKNGDFHTLYYAKVVDFYEIS